MKRFATMIGSLALAVGGVAAPARAEGTARCDEGHWPATVQGKPAAFHAGAAAGYYVWHDSYGWHLRTTTPTHAPHSFTGTIVSSGDVRVLRLYRDEGRDTASVSGHEIRFSFVTWNGVDGIDFRVGCTASLTFLLKAGGRYVPASRIWLGRYGHAPSNPFRVSRVD